MSISLPLTLAVLDGMVVDVAGQTMVVPDRHDRRDDAPGAADIHKLAGGMTRRRGARPLLSRSRSRRMSSVIATRPPPVGHGLSAGRDVITNRCGRLRSITSTTSGRSSSRDWKEIIGHVRGIAAATILGDGKVALIIDPETVSALSDARAPTPQTEEH